MRSAAQITRTPAEHVAAGRHEREQALKELHAMTATARIERPHWFTWIIDGMPPLTEAEYRAAGGRYGRGQAAERPNGRL